MNSAERPIGFPYRFLYGPVATQKDVEEASAGNCRLAVQQYYLREHNIFLSPSEIVLPDALQSGMTITPEEGKDFFASLQKGDIVYAQKLRDSRGNRFSPKRIPYDADERMRNYHLGIFIGSVPDSLTIQHIWHASFIAKGTALWPVNTFCYYYQPILARRLL